MSKKNVVLLVSGILIGFAGTALAIPTDISDWESLRVAVAPALGVGALVLAD